MAKGCVQRSLSCGCLKDERVLSCVKRYNCLKDDRVQGGLFLLYLGVVIFFWVQFGTGVDMSEFDRVGCSACSGSAPTCPEAQGAFCSVNGMCDDRSTSFAAPLCEGTPPSDRYYCSVSISVSSKVSLCTAFQPFTCSWCDDTAAIKDQQRLVGLAVALAVGAPLYLFLLTLLAIVVDCVTEPMCGFSTVRLLWCPCYWCGIIKGTKEEAEAEEEGV